MIKEKNVLDDFIKDSYKLGKKLPEIRDVLIKNGWEEKAVDEALAKYVDIDYPIAVPKPAVNTFDRLFFLNLFYFIALYFVLFNFVSMLYSILDYYLPDAHGSYFHMRSLQESIRWQVSILTCFTPLLLICDRIIRKEILGKQRPVSAIRLRLLYITMLIGALTIVISATTTVYYFLSGELTMRFILKVAVLLAICGGVFFYFSPEIKKTEATS